MDSGEGTTVEEGLALHRAGRLPEAAAVYERVVARDPSNADALHYLGVIASQQGEQQRSVELISRAIALKPDQPKFHNNLGVALRELKQLPEAQAAFSRAIGLNPAFNDARNNSAGLLMLLGRTAEAIAQYRELLAAQPDFADGWNQLGVAFKETKSPDEAARCFREVIRLAPNSMIGHVNLASALNDLKRHGEAESASRAALGLQPDEPNALANLAAALLGQFRATESLAVAESLLRLKPDDSASHLAVALATHSLGDCDRALAAFTHVTTLKPDHASAHFCRANILLLQGRLAEGFAEYEWRSRVPQMSHLHKALPRPRWKGEPLGGRRILVHAEQGAGDTFNLMRYLPLVAARGGPVLFQCQGNLVRLLNRIGGATAVFCESEAPPAYDVEAPLMSLPFIFGTTLETIPGQPPLAPHAGRVVALPETGSMKVGLVWAGNPTHSNDRNRSMALALFEPVLALEGIDFFSLQVGPRSADRNQLPQPDRLKDLSGQLEDYTTTAGVIQQLDLVLSVDTSVVHLAGVLGRPVWTLLPFVPDWRWLLERADSPWYPTMRLFRQRREGDWPEAIRRVCAELEILRDGLPPR